MDVTLPDGTVIEGVPDGTTKDQLLVKLQRAKHPAAQSLMQNMAAQHTAQDTSAGGRFLSSYGMGVANLGRAAKQMVGMGSDYQENKQIDRELMKTPAGFAGNLTSNIVNFAPLSVIPGANTIVGAGAIGATAGALQPTDTTGQRLGNMALGGALGSGVQTVAQYPSQIYEGAKNLVKKPFETAHAAVEPLYEGGRKNILARTLAEATGPGRQQAISNLKNTQELVPGSLPTAAEGAQSGGIAALQRSAAAVDPESYATRATQQNEARVKALQDLTGSSGQREFYDASRKTAAKELYEKAYEKGVDIRRDPTTGHFLPKAVIAGRKGEISKLMARPAVQDAMQKARALAANEGVRLNDPAGSVKGLDYVKRALDDEISKATGNEQRVLVDLKNRLLTTIDNMSPDYAQARVTFQQMSKPINQMDVAQSVADKSINKLTGQIQPQQYARALSDDTAASATGFNKATLANTMEPQQLGQLEAIKQDLARSVQARDLGRGPGSDTTQKLSMTNLMQRSGLPMGVVHMPGVQRVGNWLYQNADQQMREKLAKTLMNPRETAAMMEGFKPYVPMGSPSQLTKNRAALLGRALMLPAAATQSSE